MSEHESIYSEYRFVREWSYLWADYLAGLQAAYCGSVQIQKAEGGGVWNWIKSIPQKFVGKLKRRPEPVSLPNIRIGTGGANTADLEEAERRIHERLDEDWNKVYQEEVYKGTVLGMIAEEFIRQGFDLNRLKAMSLSDLDGEMKKRKDPGLDELDRWLEQKGWSKSRYYAHIWAQREGAKWLAVYDENGERSGRAYEVITGMYRDAITEAIERGASLDKLRQALLYANDSAIKREFVGKDGRLDEEAYQAFIERHLSRDMIRFAVTEASIAFNNGRILQTLNEGGEYLQFMGGGMRL